MALTPKRKLNATVLPSEPSRPRLKLPSQSFSASGLISNPLAVGQNARQRGGGVDRRRLVVGLRRRDRLGWRQRQHRRRGDNLRLRLGKWRSLAHRRQPPNLRRVQRIVRLASGDAWRRPMTKAVRRGERSAPGSARTPRQPPPERPTARSTARVSTRMASARSPPKSQRDGSKTRRFRQERECPACGGIRHFTHHKTSVNRRIVCQISARPCCSAGRLSAAASNPRSRISRRTLPPADPLHPTEPSQRRRRSSVFRGGPVVG